MKIRRLSPWFATAILSVCTATVAAPAARPDLYGNSVAPAAAQRSVVISPATRFVNVKGGETVRFVAGDQTFAWHFNIASNVSAIDLRMIAPPGLIDRKVMVYVAPDLRYYP
ncbi:CzcE family metal-binding protein [Noviherbaspirillum pedocola]|uniref:CzcE family metal-binding protein n=1 Tax=Noviherbaspirillum pedocola TaxID=2801341 RepID=A0A934SQK4_9BURK|nr:CzcE family metal-binding protein [Noviherbaspirillum pedocola]MBK4734926.1 CzcE family metal-binding protein [Noviherbaspirillum pedocola]